MVPVPVFQRKKSKHKPKNQLLSRQARDALHDHDVCGGFAKHIRDRLRKTSLGRPWVVDGSGFGRGGWSTMGCGESGLKVVLLGSTTLNFGFGVWRMSFLAEIASRQQ